jgi:flagellar export protein FliJ
MSVFRFRLATLLRIREALRDERRGQLAEAQEAEQLILHRIADIERELVELQRGSFAAARLGTVNVDRLAESARYEMILKVERESADQQRQAVAAEVAKRREALVVADREVRVLEKLRDAQCQRHREDQSRREAKQLDELAVLRHARKEALG